MRQLKKPILAALIASAFLGLVLPAQADNWRYRGHDIRSFGYYDYDVWRHGYWYHGWHGNRFAWWWRGGGFWYPYAAPVYPYPNPYVPPTVIIQQPAPPPQGPSPMQYWYYCDNPQGYYPYLTQCNIPWRPIPATPPQ